MKVVIKQRDHYLASTSRHMGSQAGYGRCWSAGIGDALKLSPTEARELIDAEFSRYELADIEVVVVGWAS